MRRIGLNDVLTIASALLFAAAIAAPDARAQDEAAAPPPDSTAAGGGYGNNISGEFTPGRGFTLIKTDRGSLNISAYGSFRYLNQLPADQKYLDHLGRERTVKARNDMNWHRTFVWLTGFFYEPRFRYNISLWSLPTTQQTLLFGNLQFTVARAMTLGVGLAPNLTVRSTQGSWPYWAGSDRQMAEEFVRGGFSSGVFVTGEPLDRFFYNVSVNTNLSQLGVTASNDTRDFSYSSSLWWMPTTGELGPRGGLGDLEHHEHLATRFGVSAGTSRESRYAALEQPPNATQIRLSDGVFPFEAGALADTVTVNRLHYQVISFDAAAKYKGFSAQAEFSARTLSDFEATGPLPLSSIVDQSFFIEAMHMVYPKYLGLYAATSLVNDDFGRHPWEVAGGASYYPYGSRSWRLNLHVIRIHQSPTGSNFGYYTAGQSGTTFSLGTDVLF